MSLRIESPVGEDALTEFLLFHDRVYESRAVAWTAFVPLELPLLMGQGPLATGRRLRAFAAREDGELVARVVAMIDQAYQAHWHEPLGHLRLFESLPAKREAVRQMMDAACEWLREQGARAARAGFAMLEGPFVIDDYESLPPIALRHNPPYYHALLKDAGFVTERGLVDYKIEVRPELVGRWQSALEAAIRAGYEITPLRALPAESRVRDFTETFNETFREHWGWTPFRVGEMASLLETFEAIGALETSAIAYRDGRPAGMIWVAPEITASARCDPDRVLREDEKLNFLGIGVHRDHRGRGVNVALAAHSFLELVRRGATWVSYTMVLDDNWPSRRTGEKLGGFVCANYVVYRREL
jgi:GNAT superfamily N-acetyltransferase